MTKIKLCGLTRTRDIETANLLMPDFIGFVFAPKSKRCISPEKAAELKSKLRPEIQVVGVFVDADPNEIADIAEAGTIDLIQLHGSEDAAMIRELRRRTKAPIIQAFRVSDNDAVQFASQSEADYVLLDAGAGDGKTFDWEIARSADRPYFLAGGLSPGNAADAVRALHPFAVDVSSGIETDGRKDPEKMGAFVSSVRRESQL